MGAMDGYLEQVQNHPDGSEFRLEIEYLIMLNMLLRDSLDRPDEALKASRLLLAKGQMLTDFHVAWAYTLYATALYFKSNFADALKVQDQNEVNLKAHFLFNNHQSVFITVFAHINLLNPDAALALIEAVGNTLPPSSLQFYASYAKLVYGLGAIDYDFNAVKESEGVPTNITNAIQIILESQNLIPGKMTLPKRRQLMFEAITTVQQRETLIPASDLIQEHWTKAYLYHKIGSYSLCVYHLNSINSPNPQELMLRTLVVGQRLELASVPGGFEVEPVADTLNEMLEIYDLAASVGPANAEWFLKMLHRWYPAAAAILNYVRPSVHFELYKRSVISFKNQNMAYGIPLPTNYCLEVFLREVLHNEELISHPPLNGNMIKMRDKLFTQHGDLTYFRTPITAFKLCYLLLKSRLPNSNLLIEVVKEEFGFPKNLKTTYEAGLVESALALVNQLLEGSIEIQEFDRKVLDWT